MAGPYIGNIDGTVFALDAASGQLRWTYDASGGTGVDSSPTVAVAGRTVHIGNIDGTVFALDAAFGRLRWKQPSLVLLPAVSGSGSKICLIGAVNLNESGSVALVTACT